MRWARVQAGGREGPGDMEDLVLTGNGSALLLSWGTGL